MEPIGGHKEKISIEKEVLIKQTLQSEVDFYEKAFSDEADQKLIEFR